MKIKLFPITRVGMIATTILVSFMATRASAQVSYTTSGSTYSQNFDNLLSPVPSNNSIVNGNVLPLGWSYVEAGANANISNRVDNGSSTTGDTFLWGATGSNERALGSFASGSLTSQFGLQLVNNSGATITGFTLTYDGEQWKDGGSSAAVLNTLAFSYAIGAASLTSGSYVNDTTLDFTALVNNTSADAAKDGNNASFRTAGITDTLTGLSWGVGQSLWLRWTDINDPGNDDGLGVDNVSFTTPTVPEPSSFALTALGAVALAKFRARKK